MAMKMLLTVNVKAKHDETIYQEVKDALTHTVKGTCMIGLLQEKSDIFVSGEACEELLDLASHLQRQQGVIDTKLEVVKVTGAGNPQAEGKYNIIMFLNNHAHEHRDTAAEELKKLATARKWKLRMLGQIYSFEADAFVWITADEEPASIASAIRNKIDIVEDTEWYHLAQIEWINRKN